MKVIPVIHHKETKLGPFEHGWQICSYNQVIFKEKGEFSSPFHLHYLYRSTTFMTELCSLSNISSTH